MQVLPSQPIGIDIGAEKLHVALSWHPHPPVQQISLDDSDWHEQLIALVPPGSTVAHEPTGGHYAAPVDTVLHHIGCTVLQVEHRITGIAREWKVSGVKKDMTDAQALNLIAEMWLAGNPPRQVHQIDPETETEVMALRMLIWGYQRAKKETTRTTNRLHQLAHSVWPSLNKNLKTYIRAISTGHVTPRELRLLAGMLKTHAYNLDLDERLNVYKHGNARKALFKLEKSLPAWLEAEHMRAPIYNEVKALTDQEHRAVELETLIIETITAEPFATLTDLWMTVPYSGPLAVAALHIATHGRAAELTKAEFRACLGSHPRISQSGETKQSREARQGFRPAKALIYTWTMSLIGGNNRVATAFRARQAKGGNHAIRVARQQLVDILWGIARTGTPYDPTRDMPDQEGEARS
jgi:hypothetical protein